jgi:carboxymethylenebutenolidase
MGSVTTDKMAADATAFFDYLASRPEVSGERFGTTGYCMGGRTSLVVAGRVPDRVGATMSFHGGGLASDDPDSPHLLADQMQAPVYVAGAENDASFTAEAAATLDKALTAADVEHTIVFYPAAHGFAVSDHDAVYDVAAAARHWAAMRDFFGTHLT